MPVDGVHVNHVVVIRMVEVGCRVHRTARGRHVTRLARTGVAVTMSILRMHVAAAVATAAYAVARLRAFAACAADG